MRRLALLAIGLACGQQVPPVIAPPAASASAVVVEGPRASQYQLADGTVVIKLDTADSFGAIVNGMRVVQDGHFMHVAAQETSPPLQAGVTRLPLSLGGGFLFHSQDALFHSATFDGALRPITGFMSQIESVTPGPSYVLVRLTGGDRVGIDPRTGQRAPLSPPGLVDVATVDDGRAAALTTFGSALVSADGGKQWTEVTSQLGGPVDTVDLVDGELWLHSSASSGRVDAGGRLTLFDAETPSAPVLVRPRDPRWHDAFPALRKAIRAGVLMDDATAVVVTQGALARVDVQTGAVVSMSPVRLPTDSDCEGVRTADDVLFVCHRGNDSFVASHGLGEQSVAIEQTFTQAGTFYAGDDGALAFGGPCNPATTADIAVCVRGPGGTWQEHVVQPNDVGDAGGVIPVMPITAIDRWIPKTDGDAIGLFSGPTPAMVDARSGEVTLLPADAFANVDAAKPTRRAGKYSKQIRSGNVDRSWTVTATGVLRGWLSSGASVDINPDATVSRTPYAFEHALTFGTYGLALSFDSAFQSTDRGQHWTEIASPPRGHPLQNISIDACGPVGCELGGFFRIGWEPSAPLATTTVDAVRAPKLPLSVLPAISCSPLGAQRLKVTTRVGGSDDADLSLGALRTKHKDEDTWVHEVVGYGLPSPAARGYDNTNDGESEPALRAITTGYGAQTDDNNNLKASGPVTTLALLRRQVGFVQAFDPLGQVRRSSVSMADYFAASRAAGLGSNASLDTDPLTTQGGAPLLAADPAASNDLVIAYAVVGEGGAFALVRPTGSRMTLEKDRTDTSMLLSAAQVGDDVILLESSEDGSEQVLRWTGLTLSNLFDVPPPPSTDFLPSNPDALAIGPHNEIAVVRTPSGGEPATKEDAALLYLPGQAPTPLAAWSTLTLADDPACKSDPGWRAIVTTTRPWVRGATPDIELAQSQTSFRVKWSTTRVCLEGVEARLVATTKTKVQVYDDPNEKPNPSSVSLSSWLVWKVMGSPASPAGAGRVGAGAGFEMTQPLKCSL